MSNQDVYNAPQGPWSYPRQLPQSWARVVNTTQPEQQEQPPPTPPPLQQQASLPALAEQAQGQGGFAGGDADKQDRPQVQPVGAHPQQPQRYVASQRDRPPREWGDPDWALKGAENYPGVAPGPYMPQGADMWGLIHSISDGLGQGGSNSVANSARPMGMYAQNMSKAFVEGQLAGYKLNYARMQQSLMETAAKQGKELQEYRELFATYGPHKETIDGKEVDSPGDPDRLAQEIQNLATQYDDPKLQAALNDGGVQAAERVLATRDGHSQDANKILQQQKLQLEIERLKVQIEKMKKGDGTTQTIEEPMPEEDGGDNTRAPGAEPPAGEEDRPPPELLEPDQPEEPAPAQPPGQGPQPAPEVPTSGPQPREGAAQPPAAPPQPTAAQNQVAGGAAPGTASDVPAPGVGTGTPTAPAAARPPELPPEPPRPTRDAPETRERPRPTGAGYPKSIDEIVRPAQKVPKGFSRQRLDILARWMMEHGKAPFSSKDPDFAIRNEAVGRRMTQLITAANGVLDNRNLSPQAKLALLDLIDPGLAAQARAVAAGAEPMPRASNSDYNRLLAQTVVRINPNYLQSDFDTRKKIRGDYTPGGYQGKIIASASVLSTAAENVYKEAMKLPNGDLQLANKWEQWVKTGTGDPAYTNFFTAWRNFAEEQVRLSRGGQGAEADIKATVDATPPYASKAQIMGALRIRASDAIARVRKAQSYWKSHFPTEEMDGYDPEAMAVFNALDRMDDNGNIPGEVPPGMKVEKKGNPQDDAAREWLKANPNDPRADAVRRKLEGR